MTKPSEPHVPTELPQGEIPTDFDPGTAAGVVSGAPSSLRVYMLVHHADDVQVVDVPDGGSILLGRAPECAITLDDPKASRKHAIVARQGAEITLRDLGSRNGTKLNGVRLRDESAPVRGGDVVKIGEVETVVAWADRVEPSGGRVDQELARLGNTPVIFVRVAVDLEQLEGTDVLGESLNSALVVEERGEGLYAALFEQSLEEVTEAVRELQDTAGVAVRIAGFPGSGRTLDELWAAAAPGEAPPEVPLDGAEGIVVADAAMLELFWLAKKVAAVQTTVLILGETGVGKEILAAQIHRWSPRSAGPYVRLNCASLPETLLESELFGHEKGAFTGAERRKIGYLETAEGGTLLLDEIGELPLTVQVKLLTVLENRELRRVGGTAEIPIDVRVLAATHRDLEKEVAEGKFREDLFYRLSAFDLTIPPLRERVDEITVLADLFARRFAERDNAKLCTFDSATRQLLRRHHWPGNVRELRNAVEHAVVLADDGLVTPKCLPQSFRRRMQSQNVSNASGSMRNRLESIERKTIEEALQAEKGNQTRAAKRLGLSRRALIYKLDKYGLKR
ncbi:MAG: sigma 54-interacting transcriptional regulator [Polyangiaceae bacterium]|nr:sigma 54-interacting transcriptional regulator [Polyangiaceae bacterium]